jgi:hypothetical protein
MKLSELFRRLSQGQLMNLAISNDGDGSIMENKHSQIIQYTNEALLRLFSRYTLKENHLIIELTQNRTSYPLKLKYAQSTGNPETFIKDFPGQLFEDDVIQILEVDDESGFKYPLNDRERRDSLFTPMPNTLQVPFPVEGDALGILYRARHPLLVPDGMNYINQEIELPFTLEGALQNYIGHLVYSHMNGQENIVKSQEYLAAYETDCAEIEARDLVSQSFHTSHTKLEQRGFV